MLDGAQSILPESDLQLYARDIQLGEIVKRSLTEPESAVVLEHKVEVKVKQVFTGQQVDEWIPGDLFVPSIAFERGDRVIYENWVGTVEAVMEIGLALNPDGEIYPIVDPFSVTSVGRRVSVCPLSSC
jgi:hypothetical protein